jgi:hypothetical protein
MWWAIRIWGAVTGLAWIVGAAVRAASYGVLNWLPLGLAGVSYVAVFAMALQARRRYPPVDVA